MGATDALVSVIVPVYNAETTLHRCVESIINQTYQNLEIILVDDGSADKSGAICDAYAEKDRRIKVIHQENRGAAVAINRGLDMVSGNILMFVDSDDWIEHPMINRMYRLMSEKECDICVCVGRKIKNSIVICEYNHYFSTGTVCSGSEMTKAALLDRLSNYATVTLFKKALWDNVRYPIQRAFADIATVYKAYANSQSVCFIDEVFYNYELHAGSISSTKGPKKTMDLFWGLKEHWEFADKHYPDIAFECAGNAALYALSVCFYRYSTDKVPEEIYHEARAFLKQHRNAALSYKRYPKTRRLLMRMYFYVRPVFWLGCKAIYLKNAMKKK